ncbi:hypothetical protein PG984_000543 [Apiospora sp. TS-2023a]
MPSWCEPREPPALRRQPGRCVGEDRDDEFPLYCVEVLLLLVNSAGSGSGLLFALGFVGGFGLGTLSSGGIIPMITRIGVAAMAAVATVTFRVAAWAGALDGLSVTRVRLVIVLRRLAIFLRRSFRVDVSVRFWASFALVMSGGCGMSIGDIVPFMRQKRQELYGFLGVVLGILLLRITFGEVLEVRLCATQDRPLWSWWVAVVPSKPNFGGVRTVKDRPGGLTTRLGLFGRWGALVMLMIIVVVVRKQFIEHIIDFGMMVLVHYLRMVVIQRLGCEPLNKLHVVVLLVLFPAVFLMWFLFLLVLPQINVTLHLPRGGIWLLVVTSTPSNQRRGLSVWDSCPAISLAVPLILGVEPIVPIAPLVYLVDLLLDQALDPDGFYREDTRVYASGVVVSDGLYEDPRLRPEVMIVPDDGVATPRERLMLHITCYYTISWGF